MKDYIYIMSQFEMDLDNDFLLFDCKNRMFIEKFDYQTMATVESSDYRDDILDMRAYNRFPFCIHFLSNDNEDIRNDLLVDSFIAAVHLANPEYEIFNPNDFIVYTREGYLNERYINTFGRSILNFRAEYKLDLEFLCSKVNDIYCVLKTTNKKTVPINLQNAVKLYELSYKYGLQDNNEKALYALSSIETLISPIKLLDRNDFNIEDIKISLDFYKGLRNNIAHGNITVEKSNLSILRMLASVIILKALIIYKTNIENFRNYDLISNLLKYNKVSFTSIFNEFNKLNSFQEKPVLLNRNGDVLKIFYSQNECNI